MWTLAAALALYAVQLLLLAPRGAAHQTQRPNIVFIMADDLGYNDVGYHRSVIRTPNIDHLSAQGVRLENYYVQPICTPSRSQFMSGRYQIHTGLQHSVIRPTQPFAMPLDSPTLADRLREAGYSTYAVGKWHLGYYKRKYLPTRRGFDRFYGFYMGSQDHFSHNRCLFNYCGVDLHDDTPTTFTNVFNETGTYSTHLYTKKATEWIQEHNTHKPFFLYLAYQAIHAPLQVPKHYRKGYSHITDKARRQFAAMTTALDEGVGQVVKTLQHTGVWNNTVLVFSTDNGADPQKGGSNYPLRGQKGLWLEGGVRAVGFVASPLLEQKGYSNKKLLHISDWFPTFLHLARGNMKGTRDIAGYNQWQTISKDAPSRRTMILHGIDPASLTHIPPIGKASEIFDVRLSSAIRVGDYKLITGSGPKKSHLQYSQSKYLKKRRLPRSGRNHKRKHKHRENEYVKPGGTRVKPFVKIRLVKLYNIRKDPLEKHDLSEKEPHRVAKMLKQLQKFYLTSVPVQDPRPEIVKPVRGAWGPWKDR